MSVTWVRWLGILQVACRAMHVRASRATLGGCLVTAMALPITGAGQARTPDEWYLPVADGCRLYVYELGSGSDTVVVLHGGFGAEHSYMLDAVRGLTARHRFVFYDQRGSLRSPCPDSSISVAKHVDDLERLRAALHLGRVTLFGHSMGTVLAASYVAAYPDRAGGIVLAGALPPDPITADDTARARRAGERSRAFLARPEIQAMLDREGLAGPPATLSPQQATHAWRVRFAAANIYHVERWRKVVGGQVFYKAAAGDASSRSLRRPYDPVPVLRAHACPVTVIAGTHDFMDVGVDQDRAWTSELPNARLIVINRAGHNAWLDDPNGFRKALASGLDRAAACRP